MGKGNEELATRNIRVTRRSNKKQQTKDGDETDKDGDKDDKDELSLTKKIGDDMDIMDNTECKFNVNSFKLVYVVNSENYLYKRMALRRAQQSHEKVSTKLHLKFAEWVDKFVEENVTEEASRVCDRWLMGFNEDNKPCQTTRHRDNDVEKAPYYTYNKYSVKYESQPAATVATVPHQQGKSSSRPSSTTPQQQSAVVE